jgi:hypothetical protein
MQVDFEVQRQAIIDEEDLRLIPILYWVSAGFLAFYGVFVTGYLAVIGAVFAGIASTDSSAPPAWLGWVFIGVAIAVFSIFAALVTAKILAGLWIRRRQHRVATMVVAGITCLEVPYGTLAGVFTFVVLARPSVQALYGVRSVPLEPVPGATVSEVPGDGNPGDPSGT